MVQYVLVGLILMNAAQVHLHHPNHWIEPLYGLHSQHQQRIVGMAVQHMGLFVHENGFAGIALQVSFPHHDAVHPTERRHGTGMTVERNTV